MTVESDLAGAIKACADLEARVRKLENYWYVTIAVAAILGVGGAYLGNTLSDYKKQIDALKAETDSAAAGLDKAKGGALTELSAAKTKAIAELRATGERAIGDLKSQKFDAWLADERAKREASDKTLSKWTRFIYQHAAENSDTSKGANGWWQKRLIDSREQAFRELP